MITIVEPKDYISGLWGKLRVSERVVYRLMRYVLRVDYDGKVFLHNVVTGQTVVLDQNEKKMMETLPGSYVSEMDQLIENHFLVPDDYDEHQQVLNLRMVLRKLAENQEPKTIIHYTILPTTACNARCYYCFEQGVKPITMTEKTAKDVVDFISANCGDKKTVEITWFGGEPTVATNRIDQICEGLRERGINYHSKMVSNGYLFTPELVDQAKDLWHLKAIQICVDGTEDSYNKIKAYVSANDNPYQRVMRNIGILIKQGITVGLRMNFDLGNYTEFQDLIAEVEERFGHNQYLQVAAHPVIGTYADHDGNVLHADDDWFLKKIDELNALAYNRKISPPLPRLPFLNGDACSATTGKSIVIRPDGGISRCAELFGDEDLVGTIGHGIDDNEVDRSWKVVADYGMCKDCVLYPHCLRLANCPNKTYCHKVMIYLNHYEAVIKNLYDSQGGNHYEGGEENEDAGTESRICTD